MTFECPLARAWHISTKAPLASTKKVNGLTGAVSQDLKFLVPTSTPSFAHIALLPPLFPCYERPIGRFDGDARRKKHG